MKFSTIGFAIISALSLTADFTEAHPLSKSRSDDGLIRLPLKRVHDLNRKDIHPQLLYQQHVNRGLRRLARMTKREVPSDEHLRARLERRHASIPEHQRRMYIPAVQPAPISTSSANAKDAVKRKWIPPKTGASNAGTPARNFVRDIFDILGLTANHKHKGNGGGGNNNAGTGTTGTGTTGTGTTTTGNTTATSDTSAGFSEIDLQAEEANTLTPSDVTTDNGTTGLDIQANDVGYSSTVQIGTPPTDFKVIMDSGSSDFWVTATKCTIQGTNTACNAKLQTLGAASSSSFVDTKKAFSVTYGSGFVSGDIITDNVVLAGLTLNAHTMGVASVESTDFGGSSSITDGLMGLAQQGLSQQGTPTPVESLATAGTITAPITSFKISRLADQLNDGEVTIGGLDTTKFDSTTLVSVPNVNTQGFWEAALDAVTVNGQDLGLSGRTAIMDTGTTLMIVPTADADAIHSAIPGAASDGQGGFTVPCTTTASVAITVGGQSFSIDPRDIAFSPVNANDLTGDCISGISAGQIGGADEWLVGDVFLKNAYFSVDESKNTVSLAKLV